MIFQLAADSIEFPSPSLAESGEHEGLLAVGGDLRPERLLNAYRHGIFPWSANPITWWSPDPRGIIPLDPLHLPRSLRKFMGGRPFEITCNSAFRQVIKSCAEVPRKDGGTWIQPEFIDAYTELHRYGHAHSVECWQSDELVGGIYGVSVGGLFAGESMFHTAPNASKVALAALAAHLIRCGFTLFDVQMVTPVTSQFGGIGISRQEYLKRLAEAVCLEPVFLPSLASEKEI